MTSYREQASLCRTENELNRLHIQLELVMSPHELAAIARSADQADLSAPSLAWLAKLCGWSPSLLETPQHFARRPVGEHVQLFEGQGKPGRRRLLIGFSGRSRRMMIPTPIFLQSFDSEVWDVAIVMHPGRSYFDGLSGVGASIPAVMDFLRREIDFDRYADVSLLGVSAGGPPAVVAALAIRAKRAVCMSGVYRPERAGEASSPSGMLGRFMRRRRITYVYGVGWEPDLISANAMAKVWGGRVLPMSGVRRHNVMSWLMRHHRLDAFMRRVF